MTNTHCIKQFLFRSDRVRTCIGHFYCFHLHGFFFLWEQKEFHSWFICWAAITSTTVKWIVWFSCEQNEMVFDLFITDTATDDIWLHFFPSNFTVFSIALTCSKCSIDSYPFCYISYKLFASIVVGVWCLALQWCW